MPILPNNLLDNIAIMHNHCSRPQVVEITTMRPTDLLFLHFNQKN